MLEYDLTITDKRGTRIFTFFGFQIARHQINHNTAHTGKHYDLAYQHIGICLDDNPKVLCFSNPKLSSATISY